MTAGYSVLGTARFQRDYRKLLRSHSDLAVQYARVLSILAEDPYNRSGSYPIKKLASVKPGDGQFRIKFQRYRFIYDINGQTVFLMLCRLRREDTYN